MICVYKKTGEGVTCPMTARMAVMKNIPKTRRNSSSVSGPRTIAGTIFSISSGLGDLYARPVPGERPESAGIISSYARGAKPRFLSRPGRFFTGREKEIAPFGSGHLVDLYPSERWERPRRETVDLLRANNFLLHKLAEVLLLHETIDAEELDLVVSCVIVNEPEYQEKSDTISLSTPKGDENKGGESAMENMSKEGCAL